MTDQARTEDTTKAEALASLRVSRDTLDTVNDLIAFKTAEAARAGATSAEIGEALGISRQAAHKKIRGMQLPFQGPN